MQEPGALLRTYQLFVWDWYLVVQRSSPPHPHPPPRRRLLTVIGNHRIKTSRWSTLATPSAPLPAVPPLRAKRVFRPAARLASRSTCAAPRLVGRSSPAEGGEKEDPSRTGPGMSSFRGYSGVDWWKVWWACGSEGARPYLPTVRVGFDTGKMDRYKMNRCTSAA